VHPSIDDGGPSRMKQGLLTIWSSPEDACGILILCITFPFVALDLVRSGGWRGCGEQVTVLYPPVVVSSSASHSSSNALTRTLHSFIRRMVCDL
jgi:hypothetical protein